ESVALIVSVVLLIFFLLYSIVYNRRMNYLLEHEEVEEISEEEEEPGETIEDFFSEQEFQQIQEQIAAIDSFSHAPLTQEQGPLTIQKDEQVVIDEGSRMYENFLSELSDSAPKDDSQRISDIEVLKTSIKSLEKLDIDHYQTEKAKVDMGKGMHYDSIMKKIRKIIKNNDWKDCLFIQSEKLENIAFSEIKQLEHEDYIETIKLMKEVGFIHDLLEVGPYTTLLKLKKKPSIILNPAEKVLVSLATYNQPLTFEKINEITTWLPNYVNQVVENLKGKGVISQVLNQEIIIENLISPKERRELQRKLIDVETKKYEKDQSIKEFVAKEKKETVIANEISESEKKSDSKEIQSVEEQNLQPSTISPTNELELSGLPEEDLTPEEKEGLEIMRQQPKPEIKGLPLNAPIPPKGVPSSAIKEGKLEKFFSEPEEANEIKESEYQPIIDYTVQLFNEINETTGGIIIFQALLWYLNQGPFPDLKKIELLEVVDELKERNIILDEFSFSGRSILVFKNIEFNKDMKKLIREFVTYGKMDFEDLETATDWQMDKINAVLKMLWGVGLLQYGEDEKYHIPGLFNTQ
ncbi:MAG: hypothetical protein ACTSWL_00955, partial [Promethearchaeota archaeon]